MAPRPTGTVTFLFSDIQGSTQLARKFPDTWPILQERHHTLLRTAFTVNQGHVFQTIGDEMDAAFETPQHALAAALDVQRALQAEDWGTAGPLRVRMGMHTGPAVPHGEVYEGYLTISHAARLMSIASGGQILLSEASAALVRDALPAGISLRDLGRHRLKDFEQVEHIFQAAAQDLPATFPPLKTPGGSPNNLPVQLTSFIGRAKEIGEVTQLLSEERMLTLTGPGGSGKTRLALQVATGMVGHFEDGVFFVALAPVSDPGLVAQAVAQTLGIREMPGRSITERLKEELQHKAMLLLLDNFEQIISAAPLVADLLVACSQLKILVTSREGLRISGEREYPVPPLGLPDLTKLPSLDSLTQYAAVQLFLQRAMAVRPDFRLTEETAPVVAQICYRLDGLPLAIELAAARIKLLPPRAMLTRLERRLEFLTGGARDLPARQQTLRNAIAWSYDLLNEDEQTLFRRLSVFVGGCSLEAVEAVAGDSPEDGALLFDPLGSLIDKSLLREEEGTNGEPRFGMLETLREYGLEQLEAVGEQDAVRRRHAGFFLAIAEQAEEKLGSAGQVEWINRMEQEHGNLRAALEWSMRADDTNDICIRLAGTLGLFWEARGYFSEGRERLAAILNADSAHRRTAACARLLARAAELAYRQSDYQATSAYAGESLAVYREVADKKGTASALVKLGNAAMEMGDYAAASKYLEEASVTWRALGDKHGTARAMISYGWVALKAGDYPLARARLVEALAVSRELGDTRSISFALSGLGEVALRQGETARAAQLVEESLTLRRQLGNKWGIGVSLGILGWIAMREGDWNRAVDRLRESLDVRREIGDQSGSAWCLERLAEIAQVQGQAEKAVRLFSAGAALREPIRAVIDPVDQPEHENQIAALQAELGEDRFAAAWDEGRALALEQAVAYALER